MTGENPSNSTNNTTNGMVGSTLGTVNTTVGASNVTETLKPIESAPQMPSEPQVQAAVQPQLNEVQEPAPEVMISDSVNPMPSQNINPMPNPEPVVNIGEPIAQPIPGTEVNNAGLMGSVPGMNNAGLDNNMNMYVNPPKNDNIGTVPPQNESPKKNNPFGKFMFLVLVLLLIAGIAYGVYYFLNMSNKVQVTLKEVTLGVGEILPDNIDNYAEIKNGTANSCSLNINNVDINTIGEYDFSVTCGKDVYNGKVNVSDKTAPVLSLTTVFKTVNDTISVDDFVQNCEDPSNCKVTLVDEEKVNGYLTTAGGPNKVEINATDDAGNSETYEADLYVTEYQIIAYTMCSISEDMSDYQATKVINNVLPIGKDDAETMTYLKYGRRNYSYTFAEENDYLEIVKDKPKQLTFDNITGEATYDDSTHSFIISTDLSLETLNNENNGSFPMKYVDFYNMYTSELEYNCSNKGAYGLMDNTNSSNNN